MNEFKVIIIVQLLIVLFGGCTGDVVDAPQDEEDPVQTKYTISGSVLDEDEEGIAGVTIGLQSFGTATTGLDGTWSKSDLEGTVTITPSRDGWGFSPGSIDVEEESTNITFNGAPVSTMLEILVEWEEVGELNDESILPLSLSDDIGSPTHFGTRLEYPEQNAIFAQALSREEAQEFGFITMEVSAAESTDLFVTAVQENEEGDGQQGQRDPVVWFGVLRDIEILEGTSTTVRMVDIDWSVPVWDFENDDVRAAYESGKMIGDKNETMLGFDIIVRNPFENRPWRDFIGLNGRSSVQNPDSEDGKWTLKVYCENQFVGQEHESKCSFWPYLKSEKFNLPEIRFSIPPRTSDFYVEWQ